MAVQVVTYNIHFGIGPDGKYDIGRIAASLEGADVIALQEVTRFLPINGARDMVADLEAAMPDYFMAYHPATETEMASSVDDGRATSRRFQFGNMILSRWPIGTVRSHLLPRRLRHEKLNLQRGMIEALIVTPVGPIRFHSVHLDHVDGAERLEQIAAMAAITEDYSSRGGAITGAAEFGFPEPPQAEDFIVLGDFNCHPGSDEYVSMSEHWADVTASAKGWTCQSLDNPELRERLDYGFANEGLAVRISGARIDRDAQGSDHMPVWMTING